MTTTAATQNDIDVELDWEPGTGIALTLSLRVGEQAIPMDKNAVELLIHRLKSAASVKGWNL